MSTVFEEKLLVIKYLQAKTGEAPCDGKPPLFFNSGYVKKLALRSTQVGNISYQFLMVSKCTAY